MEIRAKMALNRSLELKDVMFKLYVLLNTQQLVFMPKLQLKRLEFEICVPKALLAYRPRISLFRLFT